MGRAVQSTDSRRPARSTVPSGRTMAACARRCLSQRWSSLPGRAAMRTAPRRGTDRIADLVYALPGVEVGLGVHVDDEPALRELQVLHGGADRGSGQTVGPVAAQDVLREQGVPLPVVRSVTATRTLLPS